MHIYKCVRKINEERWAEFISNHPNGNIFQTPEFYHVYKETTNYEPLFLGVIDEDNNLHAVLLAVIQKNFKGILGNFTARSIIFGGPIIRDDNKTVLDIILSEYNRIIKKKAIYSQFRNMCNLSDLKSVFAKNGFNFVDHLNIIINISKREEELWKEVNSKRRNEIKRAIREGTTFSVKNSIEDLEKCYLILKGVYSRAKLPIPDFSFFESIFRKSNDNYGIKLFTAEFENKIIGCMLALVYRNTIYDFYAGAYLEYYNKYPNDLIPWEVFLWGEKNGFTKFDFGGAGKPNIHYGVRDYKKKFGGAFVNYGRFEKINKPLLMKLGKFGLKIFKIIR